jgi:ankyrin repeat protein
MTILQLLIEEGKANVDQANANGETPLFAAVERCRVAVFSWPEDEERWPNVCADILSITELKCDMDMLRWLVEKGNANVNTVSASESTPLLAAMCANVDVVRFLLSVGARVRDLEDPVFKRSSAQLFIKEELQKLEVPLQLFSICITTPSYLRCVF